MAAEPFENRLVNEKSPYLLDHAHNLVDWYPWGEEAFALAKAEDKPIFLSIGYVTSHWCYVMRTESFDNPEVATALNHAFVCVKVDREELPEIDSLYVEFAEALTSSGVSWPLNVILTPDLKPFYAVTYMPSTSSPEKMGLKELAHHIEHLWQSDEKELFFDQADKLVDLFKRSTTTRGDKLPSKQLVDDALENVFKGVDPTYGGFKGSSKFPLSYHTHFFLDYAKSFNDSRPLFFVETSLEMMRRGGIHDHVGGGFFHYSIDEKWEIPRFEKMLFDNAWIAGAYLAVWKLTKKEKFKLVTQNILDYILRDMSHPEGGFFSTEYIDQEDLEKSFYIWAKEEVETLLPKEDLPPFCEFFDVTTVGNFEEKNVLRRTLDLEEFTEYNELELSRVEEMLDSSLNLLFQARGKRKRPLRDEKIIVSWNAVMIDILIKAGMAFQVETYLNAGVKAARFIQKYLWKEERLLRRFRDGESRFDAHLDDYVSLIRALITLYEAGLGKEWLDWAIKMTTYLEEEFKAEAGAFYLVPQERAFLVHRCDFHDNMIPSGNALHAENLLRLNQMTGNREYRIQAEDILKVSGSYIEAYPEGAFYHLYALMRYLDKDAPTFIIALDRDNSLKNEINALIHNHFLPHSSIVWSEGGEYIPVGGKTTLYICKQGKCIAALTKHREIEKAFLDEKWKT